MPGLHVRHRFGKLFFQVAINEGLRLQEDALGVRSRLDKIAGLDVLKLPHVLRDHHLVFGTDLGDCGHRITV